MVIKKEIDIFETNEVDQNSFFYNTIKIEQYPDDYPFPSCLILGDDSHGNKLHVCMSDEDTSSCIITAYYPDLGKWQNGMGTRKG